MKIYQGFWERHIIDPEYKCGSIRTERTPYFTTAVLAAEYMRANGVNEPICMPPLHDYPHPYIKEINVYEEVTPTMHGCIERNEEALRRIEQ